MGAVEARWWEAPEYTQGELFLPGQSRLDPDGQALLERIAADADRGALEIPPMPKAALGANRVLRSPEAELADVADAIRIDPVLTAQVLRYANSALFGARHTMDNVSDAVSFLGLRRMRELITSAALQQVTGEIRSKNYAQREWRYAIHCAAIAKALGKRFGVDEEQCYVAGLLQDIGRLPVIRALELHDALPGEPEADSASDIILEALHRGVGVQIAKAWEEPPSIRDAIGKHLVGREPDLDGPAEFPSTRMAEVAGDFCLALGLGRHRRRFAVLESPSILDLGWSGEELQAFLEEDLPEIMERVNGVL